MSPPLTVIICTHNPRQDYLTRVIAALQQQTLAPAAWNLLLIDNASNQPVESWLTLDWHPQARMVVETTLGLTAARQRAFRETQTPTMVFVDDDNVLSPDYLRRGTGLLSGRTQGYDIGPDRSLDIDSEFDFELVEYLMKNRRVAGG